MLLRQPVRTHGASLAPLESSYLCVHVRRMAIENEGPNVSHLAVGQHPFFFSWSKARPAQSRVTDMRKARAKVQVKSLLHACTHRTCGSKSELFSHGVQLEGRATHRMRGYPLFTLETDPANREAFASPFRGYQGRRTRTTTLICSGGGLHHQGLPLRAAMWTLSGNMKHE